MSKTFFQKLFKSPMSTIKLGFYKLCVAPIKYGKKGDYDAADYWQERFEKHGQNLQAVGDEGLSIEDNEKMYAQAEKNFKEILQSQHLDLNAIRVLEVGTGTGFFTQILHEQGVKNYTGVDITDQFFANLKERFPNAKFLKADISNLALNEKYDLIVMVDVIQHIVSDDKFKAAMETLAKSLATNGTLFLSPITAESKKHLFNVRFWEKEDIAPHFTHHKIGELLPFRLSNLIVIKNYDKT